MASIFNVVLIAISSLSAMSNKYSGDQQLAQVKWEKYMRTLQVKMAPDYNFSTKSVSYVLGHVVMYTNWDVTSVLC